MFYRSFAAGFALAALNAFGLIGSASAADFERPSKLILTPLGNLLVAEAATTASPPNSGRVSIVDANGVRRTVLAGLPASHQNAVNTPAGPSGLNLAGRTLYVVIGEGNPTLAGPIPRTEIPNPNPASPIFSCVLAVHFSAATEETTTGIALTLDDHHALKSGEKLVRYDAEGGKFKIELVVDFPDYTPEPLPTVPNNVRHSQPYGVAVDDTHLYVVDGGYNLVHKVEIATGQFQTLYSFPRSPNPLPFGPPMIENVPTSICWSDGKLLVTVLNGFPFVAGLSKVQSIDPTTGAATTVISGLASAVDVIPLVDDGATVGYLTLEYSLAHLIGGPGRLQVFDASGTSIEVIAADLITPSCMAYDWKAGTIVVGQIGPGTLKSFSFPN